MARIDEKTTVSLPYVLALVGSTLAAGAWGWALQNKVDDLVSDVGEIKAHMGIKGKPSRRFAEIKEADSLAGRVE